MIWPPVVRTWGTTAAERSQPYPCDRLLPHPADTLYRGISVQAPAAVTFRWLCQLRAAPYSFDALDNPGRRSPQTLTPGLDELEAGQRVMSIFELVEFEPGRSLTLWHDGRVFGPVAGTYCAERDGPSRSRILVKLLAGYPPRPVHRELMRLILPPGDLVMMSRQLRNLKRLAERTPLPPDPGG